LASSGDQTLDLATLQAKLDDSPTGSVTGYFKTVLKGSTIETIPVEVLSITGAADPADALILFQASGTKIASFGGIVSGMSGSPIYVSDGGIDKVIGAVSYGDAFTLGGTGLATPIEAMLQIETDYRPRVTLLTAPVIVAGGVVDKVIVPAAGSTPRPMIGAIVAKPLAPVYIGGLRPDSALYSQLAARLEKKGIAVASITSALSARSSDFSTELTPGAAVGTLMSRGAMWVGALGTVTYCDGPTVLAYGHPLLLNGPTSLYMTNVWIDGVWPSSYFPYKIGSPAAVRGEVTQDRSAGLMGTVGSAPAETPVFSRAVDTDTGREATAATYLVSRILDSNDYYSDMTYIADVGASLAAAKLFDAASTPGSADTTTTIVVSDGTNTYDVVMRNVIDNSYDIPSALSADVDQAINAVLSVLDDGIEQPHIVSVSLDSAVTTHRRSAAIVGVNALEPLHEGDNRVRVWMRAYGVAATQTVDTTVAIPEGAPISGVLMAVGNVDPYGPSDGSEDAATPSPRRSIADIVDGLNTQLPDNAFTVALLQSSGTSGDSSASSGAGASSGESLYATGTVPWSVSGAASALLSSVSVQTSPVSWGEDAFVSGEVTGPDTSVEVAVYGTPAGSDVESLLATGTTVFDSESGTDVFFVDLPAMCVNTDIRVHVDGGAGYTPADGYATQSVRARVRLSASRTTLWWRLPVTLTARVTPGNDTGSVRFQYYDQAHKAWRTIARRTLSTGFAFARASAKWTPPRGKTKVRVVYGGCARNAGATSPSLTITRH